MAETLTTEKMMEYSKRIQELIIEAGTIEQRLAGLTLDEILSTLTPDEILATLSPKEILATLTPDQRLKGLNSAQRRELLRLLQEEFDADDADQNP
jgi:hypothetical protein